MLPLAAVEAKDVTTSAKRHKVRGIRCLVKNPRNPNFVASLFFTFFSMETYFTIVPVADERRRIVCDSAHGVSDGKLER